jgi:hypothetical protein
MAKLFLEPRKLIFHFQYYMCEYSSQSPGEVITNNIRLISVPNKTPDLPNEKAFPNVTCPINVKKMNIKQAMKYNDNKHHDFWTSAWETTGKEDQDEQNIELR